MQQVAGLLDTTDGNTYVFGGADSTNPPVPDPDRILTSGFYTQINARSATWRPRCRGDRGGNAGDGVLERRRHLALLGLYVAARRRPASPAAPLVQVGQGQTVQVGLLASANARWPRPARLDHGSYMRDLMRALATIGSLRASQVGDSGFQGAGAGRQPPCKAW